MKRFDSAFVLSLIIVSFVLYVRTLAPSLLVDDSAEFQTIAYTLGLGHPTGYPVYVLLAKFFTFLPVGDIAYRVNLFSAFCAALTIGLVYLMIRKLGAMAAAAVFGSLTLALQPLFWKYSSMAEVYAPAAACLALILLFALQWKETKSLRWLFLAGLFGGLSLGIHTLVALCGIAILLSLVLSALERLDWIQATFGTLLGIMVFVSAFLFLDLLNSPAGYYNAVIYPSLSVWGMTNADFDSPLERFAFLYFPPQFKGQFFTVSSGEVKTRLTEFAKVTSRNLWLALIGFVSLFIPKKDSSARWREALLLIVAFIIFLSFAVTYDVYDFQVFYIPALIILVILAGLGVNSIIQVVALAPKMPRFAPLGLGVSILLIGFYPSASEVSTAWKERVPPMLEDWESYYYRFPDVRRLETENLVKSIEDNAIVFTDWDRAYDFYYVAHVLQRRTEMDFHETYPQEGVTQLADSTIEYIEANIDSRPIYFSERPSQLMTRYKITREDSGLFRIERK